MHGLEPRLRRSVLTWRAGDLVEVTGAREVPLLPGRGSDAVARGGGGDHGPDHPSVTGRMRTPRLGFGWNEVAFSGSSPPASTKARTWSKSGLGSSTAGASVRERGEGVVDVVVVARYASAGAPGAGAAASCSHATAPPGRARAG